MRESEFIRKNKEKWEDFEQALAGNDNDPSRTSKLFVQITDDLSYARTFYPHRSVRIYLNGVAKVLFNDLNKSRKKGWKDFTAFWKKDLPLTIYQARRAMLISLLVFIGCFSLGIITSIHDDNFASHILGAKYVAMTEANIRNGDPMAVYKQEEELRTFLPILFNNLKVDFITFFSGIFMAVGSLVVMVANGVMVGVFQYLFIKHGVFWESFLGIWTHGALEIPTIILSGGAGLTFGSGLLFPGTYSRIQAFKASAKKGLIIILGVVPLTFIAALVEGYLTRHTGIPDAARLAFIILSFSSVLIYYVIYPRIVARTAAPAHQDPTLIYRKIEPFDISRLHSSEKIISETFHQFFASSGIIMKTLLPACFLCSVLIAWNPYSLFRDTETLNFSASAMAELENFPALTFILAILFCPNAVWPALHSGRLFSSPAPHFSAVANGLIISFTGCLIISGIIYTGVEYAMLWCLVLMPVIIYLPVSTLLSQTSLVNGPPKAFTLISEEPGKFLLTLLSFLGFGVLFYHFVTYAFNILLINVAIQWILTTDEVLGAQITAGIYAFKTFFSFSVFIALTSTCSALLYYSLTETATAQGLKKRILGLH